MKNMTPQEEQEEWRKQLRKNPPGVPCSMNQPLMMVIPPEGVIIPCHAHPDGHFIRPSAFVTC